MSGVPNRLLLILLALCIPQLSFAAYYPLAGDLDTTFGSGGGYVKTAISQAPQIDHAGDVLVQSDGKVVVAAYSTDTFNDYLTLQRFLANGAVDTSFGVNGRQRVPVNMFPDSEDWQIDLIQQADGKLVAVTDTNQGADFDAITVRFNTDGSLDNTFGTNGRAVTSFIIGAEDAGSAVAQQVDGKLVIAGHTDDGTNFGMALVRYNTDGTLDTTFDGDGIAPSLFPVPSPDKAYSVTIQSDGMIVVAGFTGYNGIRNFAVARYKDTGEPDTGFGINGAVVTDIAGISGDDVAQTVLQQPDGKLLVGGYGVVSGKYQATVVRYNANGSLDTTFSGDGIASFPAGVDSTYVRDMALQTNGQIVLTGDAVVGGNFQLMVMRLNDNGTQDAAFNAGVVTLDVRSGADKATAIALQTDGKMMVVGDTDPDANESVDIVLGRLTSLGVVDVDFGGGLRTINLGLAHLDAARQVAVQADGKIVAGGTTTNISGFKDFSLTRYNVDGSLDSSFDGDGIVQTDFSGLDDELNALELQPDGKILAAGWATGDYEDFAIVRYNTDGSLDTTFGTGGIVTTSVVDGGTEIIGALHLMADGRIVAVGRNYMSARYLANGSLDTTFGPLADGISAEVFVNGDQPISGMAFAVIEQADGKLVMAGANDTGPETGGGDFTLVRLNADGTVNDFNGADPDDHIFTDFEGDYDVAYDMIQRADGRLIVLGRANIYDQNLEINVNAMALVGYNADGTLDGAFGNGGLQALSFASHPDSWGLALVEQADGKLVAVGGGTSPGTMDSTHFVATRLTADGYLDPFFGVGNSGYVSTGNGLKIAEAAAVALDVDGNAVVAGVDRAVGGDMFTVMRHLGVGDVDADMILDNSDTDNDNDTMPDAWEITYGLDMFTNDAAGDLDSDGRFNLQEYQDGTNPALIEARIRNDFNADRTEDLLMRSSSTGGWRLFSMGSGGITTANNAFMPVTGGFASLDWQLQVSNDFDGDGDTDLLMRNMTSGEWKLLITQNSAVVSSNNFFAYTNLDWVLSKTADFNGDGYNDILLHNTVTGGWRVFYISTGVVSGDANLTLYTSGWSIAYADDIDSDFDADILMRSDATGEWRLFTMAAGVVLANSSFSLYQNLDWQITTTIDLQRDGDKDILMRNSVTGQWRTFQLEFGGVFANFAPGSIYLDPLWIFSHQSDVDGDGDEDLFLRGATGQWRVFLVNGANITAAPTALDLYNNLQWGFVGSNDIDGDGIRDVLMRDNVSGIWRVFIISGGIASSNINPGIYEALDWSLQDASP